jgi:hypothetical protein
MEDQGRSDWIRVVSGIIFLVGFLILVNVAYKYYREDEVESLGYKCSYEYHNVEGLLRGGTLYSGWDVTFPSGGSQEEMDRFCADTKAKAQERVQKERELKKAWCDSLTRDKTFEEFKECNQVK